jgi:hypothetical protein
MNWNVYRKLYKYFDKICRITIGMNYKEKMLRKNVRVGKAFVMNWNLCRKLYKYFDKICSRITIGFFWQ